MIRVLKCNKRGGGVLGNGGVGVVGYVVRILRLMEESWVMELM